MVNSTYEETNQGAYEEFDRSQVIGDVWEDLIVLHKLLYM